MGHRNFTTEAISLVCVNLRAEGICAVVRPWSRDAGLLSKGHRKAHVALIAHVRTLLSFGLKLGNNLAVLIRSVLHRLWAWTLFNALHEDVLGNGHCNVQSATNQLVFGFLGEPVRISVREDLRCS